MSVRQKVNWIKGGVLALSCLGTLFAQPTLAGEHGEFSQFSTYKQWSSGELCFPKYCLWRAGTDQKENANVVFLIDKTVGSDDKFFFQIQSNKVSQAALLTWDDDTTDHIKLKIRIDKGQTRELIAEREIDKKDRRLYWYLPIKDHEDFIKDLQQGTTLRIRAYADTPFTMTFSLSGAYATLERIKTENYKDERRKKAINSDPYFKDEI